MEPQEYLDEPRRTEIATLDNLIRRVAPDLEPAATERALASSTSRNNAGSPTPRSPKCPPPRSPGAAALSTSPPG